MIPDGVSVQIVARKGGGKGGSGGGNTSVHTATEAPNTLRSRSTARILEVISEGPVKGLVDGLKGVYLDRTPILNADGSANFNLNTFQFRYGEPDQDVIPGFAAGEAEKSVGVELTPSLFIVRRITAGVDAVRFKIRAQALYTQTTDGDVNGAAVEYVIDLNVGGAGWVRQFDVTMSGKTMSSYEQAWRMQLPKTTQTIDVRVARATADLGSNTSNTIYWNSYTEIVDGTLNYSDSCVAAMVVDSQYFPNVPTRGYLLDGIICQVPTNYDPIARTYTGDWDGTFKPEWTNNPAWILYEIATNLRFGTGRDIDAAAMDKWSLYECSVYNDELVQDGEDGTEPRFTCNCVLNTREDAFKVLNAIASCMRALLYYAGGTIFVVQDRPIASPSRLFSPSNVTDGIFDYAGADYRSRFNAVDVSWNDPEQDYEAAVELVQDPALLATQPYRDTQAAAFATTSKGQAIRHGRWLIYTGQNETEAVTFKTSLENADVRPGELILIQDPGRAGARLAGRTLEQPAANELQLDAPAPGIALGWKIYLTIGSGITETTVSNVINDSHVVVVGLPDGLCPAATVWLAHDLTIEPTPWRVAAIKEEQQNQYLILATQFSPGKFSYVDDNVQIPDPPYSLIPKGPLVGPTDFAVKEYIYVDPSGVPQFGVVMSWVASTDSRVAAYVVEMEGPSGDFRKSGNIAGVALDMPAMRNGTWNVYITASDNLGRRSIPLVATFSTVGLTDKPLPPVALWGAIRGDWLDLEWLPTGEVDVLYYWIQYSPRVDGSATWVGSTSLVTRVARNATRATVPARAGTYLIKTIDALGQESVESRSLIILDAMPVPNNIVVIVEEPTWAGVRNLWQLTGTEIQLPPPVAPEVIPPDLHPGPRGLNINGNPTRYSYYNFAGAVDQGAVGPMLITSKLDAFGSYGGATMSTWIPLAIAVPLAMGASNAWDASFEFRSSNDNVTFGAWKPFTAANINARAAQFRLTGVIYDLLTTLRASQAHVSVDVADRQAKGNNVAFDGVGRATVVYTPGFYITPNVQFTGFAPAVVGAQIVIIASDKHGFTCEQRRDSGAAVAGGSFNWLASGYGVS